MLQKTSVDEDTSRNRNAIIMNNDVAKISVDEEMPYVCL